MADLAGPWSTAIEIAAAVRSGAVTATAIAESTLERIEAVNRDLNAYTETTRERAIATAAKLDAARDAGRALGPLAGVPYAVKNLFDVEGLSTRAGSLINRKRPPATADAILVKRMDAAGAVLLGTLHMGEYAYDFTGENAHDGTCRNPHDTTRMTGGSSSGCGAATAGGIAPISLGSDTNGSLRVPASLCGVFSLKPTYGRLPRTGTFPFVDSLDHLGPFARSATDLSLAYDVLQGWDPKDHACARRPIDPVMSRLDHGIRGLKVGALGGWFARNSGEAARAAVETVSAALKPDAEVQTVCLDEAEAGRAAAYLITNSESAAFHLDRLRRHTRDFDPDTRDRFLAGALLPAAWVARAQAVRRWWMEQALAALGSVDVLLAPATPCSAPRSGSKYLDLDGHTVPLRPSLGLLAQPFSCIGLPVVTVPVFSVGDLPIGVQVVASPWKEDQCLRVAKYLEEVGAVAARARTSVAA